MNKRKRVGVIRGGPSSEREVSLKSGEAVLRELRENLDHRYEAMDIIIDEQGRWSIDGQPIELAHLPLRVDVIFNALHGAYGEDGQVQKILESHCIPFTGSGSLASAVGMNKILTKKILLKHGLKTPYGRELSSEEILANPQESAAELFRSFLLPAVIKPAASGSSVGVSVVRQAGEIEPALVSAAKHGGSVLVEEFIPGQEATAGVLEGFRDQELYALPPVEIRPRNKFFDYEAKYAGASEEIVPATFPDHIKRELETLAQKAHRALVLRHYSRSDFIIHPRRGIYILETNTLPGLTNESLLPKALTAVGGNLAMLVDHLLGRAML